MPSKPRAEWQNFVNSEDIQPLGSAYGYQKELPLDQRGRIDRFFDDPRNLRGLLGEITTDLSRDPRVAALRTKQNLQQNPQFLKDVDLFMSRSPATAAAGLQDAYAIRQLFGESPTNYGMAGTPNVSTERRGVTLPSTGERVRVTQTGELTRPAITTSELSPSERTHATSLSLRPQVFVRDLELLGDPELMRQAGVERGSNVDRARELLSRTLNENIASAYEPVDLDAYHNVDDERVRRLVGRNEYGQLTVAGEYPGEIVSGLQNLLRESGADPDYILDYLENQRELPSESSAPRDPFDFDYGEDTDLDNEQTRVRSISSAELDKFIRKYPEQQLITQKSSLSRGTRIPKEQLISSYGTYIPENFEKLPLDEVKELKTNLFAGDNPQARELFYRTIDSKYSTDIREKLAKARQYTALIDNPAERARVTAYLDDYIKNIESKVKPVSARLAGVGGGEYLQTGDIYERFPAAAKKLEVFGETPYVPEGFESTLKETFYSKSGRPYELKINRTPQDKIYKDNLSTNFLNMIEEKPFAGVYNIDFTVNDSYGMDPTTPEEVRTAIQNFVNKRGARGLPGGAVLSNSPLSDEIFRKERPGNKRATWYQRLGFGGQSYHGQFAYIDPETGTTVPIQPYRQKENLVGEDFMRAYYATDPATAALRGAGELGKAIKRTPASLAPGIADLIPSPEAVRTGYAKGPVAMGKQMGQEFVQSLPVALGASSVLAAAPVLAPGVGAGLVGTAGVRALNEVVKQETGEGIVPKMRQFIGTAPRSGAATPAVLSEKPLVSTLKALTPQQKQEMQRRLARSELDKRIDLVKERFNPRKGEFGLSEMLFGR